MKCSHVLETKDGRIAIDGGSVYGTIKNWGVPVNPSELTTEEALEEIIKINKRNNVELTELKDGGILLTDREGTYMTAKTFVD